jgi:ABC-type dipeptide/oligopeptide/nickel transport system permease component
MLAYIARRAILLPMVLFGVTALIFLLMQFLSPYQLVALYVTDITELQKGPEYLNQLVAKHGLDDPLLVKYGNWLGNLLRANFGWSQSARMPVAQAMGKFIPSTLELVLWSILPIVFGGIWLGKISATRKDTVIDHGARLWALAGISLPAFLSSLLLLALFYSKTGWFPPGRISLWAEKLMLSGQFHQYTRIYTLDALLNRNGAVFLDALRHLVLPCIALMIVQWAGLMRIMRSTMLEVLRQDYVITARAKGLRERIVINKHAKRNALLPVVTVAGGMISRMIGGLVVIETVFSRKGLGSFAMSAALQLDFPAILGFAVLITGVTVAANLVVDLLYAWIDPRVRLG